MKKSTKFLLAFAAMTTLGFNALAQDPKSLDLEIQITSPVNGAVIDYGDTAWLEFNIKNNGPAAITATDTIFITDGGSIFPIATAGIASGVSLPLAPGLFLRNQVTQDTETQICLRILDQADVYYNVVDTTTGDTTRVDAAVTYTDTDSTNNTHCAAITLKAQTVSIGTISDVNKEELSIYPNPATTEVNFVLPLDKAENVIVSVKDIAGREVLRQDYGKVQAGNTSPFTLNVSNLNAGLYFIELNAGDRKAVGRVTVR